MRDEEIFVKVSPSLYFEVLLRRAHKELELATHTVERTGRQNIPVFDTQAVVGLLARPQVLEYLSQMLASFMRIRSFVVPLRPRGGIRRRMRFNDMDIDSLLHFCAQADESQRLSFYKRIADVCLFVSGVFPEQALRVYQQAATARGGPGPMRPSSRTLEDYEREGRQFYGLAEGHPAANELDMSRVFGLLREHFTSARKPLTFISAQYLHSRRSHLFGAPTS